MRYSRPVNRLDESGERVQVRGRPRTHNEQVHVARYRWACEYARGRILDAACGVGYGSALLSRCGTVTGIDYDAAAIEAARKSVPAGIFVAGELPRIPFADASFDTVVSFETIEHIKDYAAFLRSVHRVLVPKGILLVSTPNRTRPGATDNPWHVREFALQELQELLSDTGFVDLRLFCQMAYDESPASPRRQILWLNKRLPALCRPSRFWDRAAFGSQRVIEWQGEVPMIWLIHGRADP